MYFKTALSSFKISRLLRARLSRALNLWLFL